LIINAACALSLRWPAPGAVRFAALVPYEAEKSAEVSMRRQIVYGILLAAVLGGFASNIQAETVWANPGVAPLFDAVLSVRTQATAAENEVGEAGR
jgi:hypothetical protein